MPELEAAALAPAEVPELPADDAREVLAPDEAAVVLVVEPAGVVALVVAPPVLVAAAVVEAAPPDVDSVEPDVEEPAAVELVQSVEPPV